MEKYKKARTNLNETNDCGVIVVAEIAEVPYEVAQKALADQGRELGRPAMGRHIFNALQEFGYRATSRIDGSELAKMKRKRFLTVRMLEEIPMIKKGKWIGITRNHIFAIKDGAVKDWTRGRRFHVESLFKINKI